MGRFTYEILSRMVQNHPEAQFSFFFDRPFDPKYVFGENVRPYVLNPPARHPILFYIWFEWSVAQKLKRLKPDVFFSPDGFLSLRSAVPQVPVFHDLAFMYFPEDIKRSEARFYHKYWPRYAEKACHILSVSEYTRQDIIHQFGTSPDKVSVVYNASSSNFHPIPENDQDEIRKKYSNGKPFFHFVGAIQPRKNLDNLIHAFDQYKAETGADHQLLIVGRKAWNFEEVVKAYAASSYQNEIHFTGFVSDADLNGIYASSDGLCYVPYFEGFGLPIVEAFRTDCPVISSNTSSMPEIGGEAVLLVDPQDPGQIKEAMKQIIEPGIGAELVRLGHERKSMFSWERSAEQVWEHLMKCVN